MVDVREEASVCLYICEGACRESRDLGSHIGNLGCTGLAVCGSPARRTRWNLTNSWVCGDIARSLTEPSHTCHSCRCRACGGAWKRRRVTHPGRLPREVTEADAPATRGAAPRGPALGPVSRPPCPLRGARRSAASGRHVRSSVRGLRGSPGRELAEGRDLPVSVAFGFPRLPHLQRLVRRSVRSGPSVGTGALVRWAQ